MSYAGSKACYNSIATYNHQLLLLGMEGVHVITLRSWNERINSLLKEHQYRQALQLGLSFYQGKGKGLVGLSWNEEKRKKVIGIVKSILYSVKYTYKLSYQLLLMESGSERGDGKVYDSVHRCLHDVIQLNT